MILAEYLTDNGVQADVVIRAAWNWASARTDFPSEEVILSGSAHPASSKRDLSRYRDPCQVSPVSCSPPLSSSSRAPENRTEKALFRKSRRVRWRWQVACRKSRPSSGR